MTYLNTALATPIAGSLAARGARRACGLGCLLRHQYLTAELRSTVYSDSPHSRGAVEAPLGNGRRWQWPIAVET